MGLTIHYTLHADVPTERAARRLVERLHLAAGDLPLAELHDVVEFSDDDGPAEFTSELQSWLHTQSHYWLIREDCCACVRPRHVIAFATIPGPGSEPANFGLCHYPAKVEVDGRSISTGLAGWNWRSFCKTQYASNPDDGGQENFVRSHLAVVRLLDCAQELNLLREVQDESRYWETRNTNALVKVVGDWNRQMAGFVGQFQDQIGRNVVAPIKEYPTFEHLEAEGRRSDEVL